MGGWLMIYNFGVAKCLLDHGLHAVHPKQSIIGSSAGSLAAAAIVLEADIDKVSANNADKWSVIDRIIETYIVHA